MIIYHSRKSLITQHIKTKQHLNLITQLKFKSITQLSIPKKHVVDICFEGFTGANIPLHKFRNPAVIKMFQELDIEPPGETTIRKN